MFNPKDAWSLYTVVAQLVRVIAQLAASVAAANGKLPGGESSSKALLDDVLSQLDALLVLGTHFSVVAAKTEVRSGAVQRLRRQLGQHTEDAVSLEEIREFVAQSLMQVRRAQQEELTGPDTPRNGPLAEGSK